VSDDAKVDCIVEADPTYGRCGVRVPAGAMQTKVSTLRRQQR
jgi:hypothetical protein